ncbi:MAG: hypothetical protein MZV70_50300 [Desulfobacterales bacterium]|nr:hypothetical protein [Desulfobacterales bacterium]
MPDIEEWDDRQKLAFEKESLGFYLSGHPLTRFEDAAQQVHHRRRHLASRRRRTAPTVRIGGLVRGTKTIKTKKGDLMAFVTIEDLHGAVEVTVFSRLLREPPATCWTEDNAVLVQGQVQKDEQSVKLVADTHHPAGEGRGDLDRQRARQPGARAGPTGELLLRLREVLQRYPGTCKAYLHLRGPTQTEAVIELPEGIHLKAGAALRREVSEVLGDNALETRCAPV